MGRKSIIEVIKEITLLLEKEKELSTRQISLKTRPQWRTVDKALGVLVFLNVVKKKRNVEPERSENIYALNSKEF